MSPLFDPITGTTNAHSPDFLAGLEQWKMDNGIGMAPAQLPATPNISPAIQQLLSQINGMAKTTSQFGANGLNLNGDETMQSSLGVNWSDLI